MQPSSSRARQVAWLALILMPLALVAAGLTLLFVWQGSRDGITPKWKKDTNAPAAETTRDGVTPGDSD